MARAARCAWWSLKKPTWPRSCPAGLALPVLGKGGEAGVKVGGEKVRLLDAEFVEFQCFVFLSMI